MIDLISEMIRPLLLTTLSSCLVLLVGHKLELLRWWLLNNSGGGGTFRAFHEFGHLSKDSTPVRLLHIEAEHVDLAVANRRLSRCKRRRSAMLWISLLRAGLIITWPACCAITASVRRSITIINDISIPQKPFRRSWADSGNSLNFLVLVPVIVIRAERHLLFDPNRSLL